MPIAFPRATGPVRSVVEGQWWKNKTKAFDVVPAPSMARTNVKFSQTCPCSGQQGWSLAPGKSTYEYRAVNLRRLNTAYDASISNSTVNPARNILSVFDNINSNDRVLGNQNERIVGISRDATGSVLGSCAVKVFRTSDDLLIAQTVSDASGNWTIYPNQIGPFFYYVEYKSGSPDVFGTSPNTNTTTQFTPGQ
tara:strand:- start:331 stop:912 length:582 start_codon:yes stop_codon:yes gene_type:complete